MSRSGSPYSAPRDANRHTFLVAASTADGVTPVVLEADPVTHQLQTNASSGGTFIAQVQYNSTAPTMTNGQVGYAQSDINGRVYVNQGALTAANDKVTAYLADGAGNLITSNSTAVLGAKAIDVNIVSAQNDKFISNVAGTTATIGTTAVSSVDVQTGNAVKAVIILNIASYTSGSLTVTVSGVTAQGFVYTLLASAAVSATGQTVLRIFPGATPSANAVANDAIPRVMRIAVSGTFVATYGLDYQLSV